MWTREQLKTNGKMAFSRNYWECVAVALIMGFFSGVPNFAAVKKNLETQRASLSEFGLYGSSVDMSELYQSLTMAISLFTVFGLLITAVFVLLKLLVGNALMVGGNLFFIENRNGGRGFGIAASSFRSGRYGNIVLTMFLMDLFISLWSLLLIIPGIIKSYEYLMVPYILAENPQMDRKEIFEISRRMMDGEKMNAFLLDLSFLGWIFLTVLTCGVAGILYVQPYMMATRTELYIYNKVQAYNEGYIA